MNKRKVLRTLRKVFKTTSFAAILATVIAIAAFIVSYLLANASTYTDAFLNPLFAMNISIVAIVIILGTYLLLFISKEILERIAKPDVIVTGNLGDINGTAFITIQNCEPVNLKDINVNLERFKWKQSWDEKDTLAGKGDRTFSDGLGDGTIISTKSKEVIIAEGENEGLKFSLDKKSRLFSVTHGKRKSSSYRSKYELLLEIRGQLVDEDESVSLGFYIGEVVYDYYVENNQSDVYWSYFKKTSKKEDNALRIEREKKEGFDS